ncbi:hypothetical protein HNQ80_002606 [Anaerosolibacter carboniphilus]|uniref:RNA-binding protein KhpB N-terminal domain-containing protein n=1 Tax=Anaerosolibacter carboniphilus TaxID=1417629 RepID=A0A841KRY6_9FIRM|nr:FapA family protein [Anaerosolibacter carboniphilus]MBB6216504.1 hypothetical protein [Anaerosolibacter carboniphilus]
MTKDYVVAEGKTYEEALGNALKELDTTAENVEVEIIEEGKSIFNLSVRNCKVRVTRKNVMVEKNILYNNDNENGHYELKFDENRKTLLIYPPKGTGKAVSYEEIISVLKTQGIINYDTQKIKDALGSREICSVEIEESSESDLKDAEVLVEISKDEMRAFITIIPPKGGRMVTKENVIETLTTAGVVYGIDSIAIENLMIESNFNKKVEVARGKDAIHGIDGTMQYMFDIHTKIRPEVLEDGSVNLKELHLIHNVKKGDILAIRTLPTEGVEGTTVRGRALSPKTGKQVQFKKGKNVTESTDELQLIADINGQAKLIDDKVTVLQVYEINGNVDNATGNINFNGKVVVKGNVTTGFEIRCEGDVEVHGVVEGAIIEAEGNIILHKGIQGNNSGKLVSKQDIIARYMENCYAKAYGNIQAEVVMHCKLESKGQITVSGKKGLIVGGEIRANNDIYARIIGSHMATATKLEVGIDPEIKERYDGLKEELDNLMKNIDSVNKAIDLLSKMSKVTTLPPDKQEILTKSINTKQYLDTKIESVNGELMNLKQLLQSLSNGRIHAENIIYPGVKISIGNSFYFVRDQIQRSTIVRESGEIKIIPYMG